MALLQRERSYLSRAGVRRVWRWQAWGWQHWLRITPRNSRNSGTGCRSMWKKEPDSLMLRPRLRSVWDSIASKAIAILPWPAATATEPGTVFGQTWKASAVG